MNEKNKNIAIGVGLIIVLVLAVFLAQPVFAPFFTDNESETTTEANGEDITETGETTTNASGDNNAITDEDEIWDKLSILYEHANKYYEDNFEMTRLVSRNGELYNKAAEKNITLEMFRDRYKLIGDDLVLPECKILLLKPVDVKHLRLGNDSTDYKVYLSYKHPVTKDYYVYGENAAVVVSAEDYDDLMAIYTQEHGPIRVIAKDDGEQQKALDAINKFRNTTEDFFVRAMSGDNLHIHAIVSPKSDYNIINQYILGKTDDGSYAVLMSDLEHNSTVYVSINKQYPNVNLDMVPAYTLSSELTFMFKEFPQITNYLINSNIIDAETAKNLTYASATDKYMYLVYNDTEKFFGIFEDDVWNIRKVDNIVEPMAIMIENETFPPTFIFCQD